MKLLTVDWDYFFPMPDPDSYEAFALYDWSQAESEFLIRHVWQSRAQGFLQNDLPLPQVEGWSGFWDQFTIADDATLYMGESHLFALDYDVREDIDEVWLFDAHHDAGYRGDDSITDREGEERWECENWMVWYHQNGAGLHVRYPEWRAWAMDREPEPMVPLDRQVVSKSNMPDVVFDRIYVCRSGAWVPPWCDAEFVAWVEEAPVSYIEYADSTEGWEPDVERDFDIEAVKAHAEFFRKFAAEQSA